MAVRLMRGAPRPAPQVPAGSRWARVLAAPVVLAVALVAGCGREIELHSGLSEADANELVVALAAAGVQAGKNPVKQGFSITVPADQLSFAVSVLRSQGLPRFTFARMGDVFKKDGMISSPMEERGRYLFALSQELESTLSQIDGVVLAKVHPVLPERTFPGEAAQVSSCAVFIKHRADFDPVLYEDRIRQLVLAGIPGLGSAPERDEPARQRVSVVFSPVLAPVRAAQASGHQVQGMHVQGLQLAHTNHALAIALGLLTLVGLLALAYHLRERVASVCARALAAVRSRLQSRQEA